jgi:hypothetical protein
MSRSDSSKHKWILARWDGEALHPHANYDREQVSEKLSTGDVVRLQFAQPRSLPRHRLYWAIVRTVLKNNNFFATDIALHKTLLMACGVVEPVATTEGEIVLVPSSIAFDAMGEDEFKQYLDAALIAISTSILPGVDLDLLLKEAKQQSKWKDTA